MIATTPFFALLAQALAAPSAVEPPISGAALRVDWMGGFRHTQLIDVREGQGATAIVATAFVARGPEGPVGRDRPDHGSCVALYALPLDGDPPPVGPGPMLESTVELGDTNPFATLRVSEGLLPSDTWFQRPTWRVVALGAQYFVVLHDVARKTIRVQRIGEVDSRATWTRCDTFWDVELVGDDLRILTGRPGELSLLQLALDRVDAPAHARPLLAGGDDAAAAFVSGARSEVVAAQLREGGLTITALSVTEASRAVTELALDVKWPEDCVARIAARRNGATLSVAAGPFIGPSRWRGVAYVAQLGPEASLRTLYTRGQEPEGWDGAIDMGFGQTLAVLPDLDGDGAHDVAIGDSYCPAAGRLELLSGAEGTHLGSHYCFFCCLGSSLSFTADARYALASGAYSSEPELLHNPAEAILFRLAPPAESPLHPVQSWTIRTEYREPKPQPTPR